MRKLNDYSNKEVLEMYEGCGNIAAQAAAKIGCGASSFKDRLIRIQSMPDGEAEKRDRVEYLYQMLDERGIDPREVNVTGARISASESAMKVKQPDGSHKVVITPLKHSQIVFSPKFEEGPDWPVIQRAKPAIVKYAAPSKIAQPDMGRVFLWPDTQIGYFRNLRTDALEPFHDLAAVDVALQMLHDYQPSLVVILGDFIDLAQLSKYLQIAEFQTALQPAIDYGADLLARIRSIVGPSCRIEYVEGNHERRMAEYVTRNALAAYGLRRGGDRGRWPLLSIPTLLNLDDLNIGYSAAYPAGQFWITPKLVAQHAPTTKKKDLRATVIHGHTPQYKVDSHTVHYHDGTETFETYSIPGLMRIDNVDEPSQLIQTAVPSDQTRVDWSQGVGTVEILDDNTFCIQVHKISRGLAIFQGRVYRASQSN